MDARASDGFALVAALLLTLMLSALAAAFALVTSSEAMIAANFRNDQEAQYAAGGVAERAIADLLAAGDWNAVLNGTLRSSFADGLPSGTRPLADGSTLDLDQVVNQANCSKSTTCSGAEMDAVTSDRPRGPNNPRWQLFAWGPLRRVLPNEAVDSPYYTLVLVGDDASETDGDPSRDALSPASGAGVVALRAQVFGPRSGRRVIEVVVARSGSGGVRVLSWR